MLDLHCHILPAVDDGAVDLDASVAMARVLVGAGYTAVAPSPHFGEGPGGDVPVERAKAVRQQLILRLDQEEIALELLANAEHHVTPELFMRLAKGDIAPIGGGRWLLVELPWGGVPQVENVLFMLQSKGYRLLLAHPERYKFMEVDIAERLVERGVKLQLELGSFADLYGRSATTKAKAMMERGLAHVFGTDMHQAEGAAAWIQKAQESIRRHYGEPALMRGVRDNPGLILHDARGDEVLPLL